MIRSYLDKLYIVIFLTILSFDLKAQTYIYDGVYVGGGFHFFNWTFDEVNYKNDNGNGGTFTPTVDVGTGTVSTV